MSQNPKPSTIDPRGSEEENRKKIVLVFGAKCSLFWPSVQSTKRPDRQPRTCQSRSYSAQGRKSGSIDLLQVGILKPSCSRVWCLLIQNWTPKSTHCPLTLRPQSILNLWPYYSMRFEEETEIYKRLTGTIIAWSKTAENSCFPSCWITRRHFEILIQNWQTLKSNTWPHL